MVVATPLTHISLETLTQVFNAAFSNYEVPVHMEREQLISHTHTLGVSPEDSIGLFDEETLIGFLLVARKGTIAYDAGTGIIPDYQGNGYAHHLIEFTLEHLKKRGVKSFILEVIDTNKRAKNLYTSHGFSTMRSLCCYQVKKDFLQGESSVQLCPQKNLLIPVGTCAPSWQNSKECIKRGGFIAYDIFYKETKRGVICFNPNKGSIAQIYIEPKYRRKGYAKQAIIAAKQQIKGETMGMLNVAEDCVSLNALLNTMGFSLLLTQSEMRFVL